MKLMHSSITLLSFTTLIFLPCPISSQSCLKTCGNQLVKYPFGTGLGCGDPRFQKYVTCNQQQLTFTTHTGCYPITTVDYMNQVIYISDATMSTCDCARQSKGFGLDWDAPFTFHGDNVFALLDCSTSSSPVYRTSSLYNGDQNSTTTPLCDNEGPPVCSLLNSCRAISTLNLPISSCCVYTPVDLGPSFEMDLQKLQCPSYSGLYSFNAQETNPENWKFGVALKYKFSINNDYPSFCANCEKSDGVCGYTGAYNSFVCNCRNGVNTTTECFLGAYWNNGSRLLPSWKTGSWLNSFLGWCLVWASL